MPAPTDTFGIPPAPVSLLVTVGSTLFPALTSLVLSPSFLARLSKLGITRLWVQYGNATLPPSFAEKVHLDAKGAGEAVVEGVRVIVMRFSNDFGGLVKRSEWVVSHAGSGSILTVLRYDPPRPLLVVPNESLMDNHQAELADALGKEGYLMVSKVEQLDDKMEEFLSDEWKKRIRAFPGIDKDRFKGAVDDLMGYE
ncbi:hypothetical protein IAT38_000688 [Cryptococcus sp. DSM 104549]